MSKAEDALEFQLKALKIPYEREFRFHKTRRWRFDFCLAGRLAVEVEGIVYKGKGRHQTGTGYQGDLDKYEAALLDGWIVYRCSPEMVTSGRAITTIEQILAMTSARGDNTLKKQAEVI